MNFATALLAGLALKPMRQRWLMNRADVFKTAEVG
jgi:hypothetical protein